MHVGTYPTRNFATLGPSELRPPFTGALSQCLHTSFLPSSTGQVSDPIRHLTILQSLVFLLNSRPPLFNVTSKKVNLNTFYGHSFSRSYRVFLPSSFSTILSSALVCLTCPPVSVLVRFMSFMPFLKTKKAMKSLYFFIKLPYALLIKKTEIPSRRAFARLLLETVYLESGLSLL
jgi:hypothetical protein